MTEYRSVLERAGSNAPQPDLQVERVLHRRDRKRRNQRIRAGVLGLAIAIGVGWLGVNAIRSTPSPADHTTPSPGILRTNGEVLRFTGNSRLSHRVPGDLVAVNPETGEERVLVQDLDTVFSAKWSADGRWVAYETAVPDGRWGLWVVGGSREPRLVATGAQPDLMADFGLEWLWSPTGAQLAITTDSTLARTIDLTTGETTDLGIVDDHGGPDVNPHWAWSPDGTRIAFQAPPSGALSTVDVRSGERSLLVRVPVEDFEYITAIMWSPDGASIAVVTGWESGSGRLYVMDADGSNLRVVADNYDPLGVAWSPDGTRLAFGEGSEADGVIRIRVATMDGAAPAKIGSVPFAGCTYNYQCGLAWSPDGSQIAFHKHEGGEVTVFDAGGAGEAEPIDELTYRSWAGGFFGEAR